MQRFTRPISRVLSSLQTVTPTTKSKSTLGITQSTTARLASTNNNTMAANSFLELVKARRSIYPLNKNLPISTDRIQEIVKEGLQHVPSSFNSQSNRVVVLFGAEHDKFWDITTETLKAIVPEDKWEPTAQRMAMFKGAAGSVRSHIYVPNFTILTWISQILFFEDQTVVEGMQAKFALYADRFPVWATQSTGMLQHTLWVALEAEGLGANLQHYNPLVDEKVAETWKLPSNWKLNAQLVFGGRVAEAGEKTFAPLEEKYKVFGA